MFLIKKNSLYNAYKCFMYNFEFKTVWKLVFQRHCFDIFPEEDPQTPVSLSVQLTSHQNLILNPPQLCSILSWHLLEEKIPLKLFSSILSSFLFRFGASISIFYSRKELVLLSVCSHFLRVILHIWYFLAALLFSG